MEQGQQKPHTHTNKDSGFLLQKGIYKYRRRTLEPHEKVYCGL